MPHVRFTPHLVRFFPDLVAMDVEATDVAGVVAAVDRAHPGLGAYLVDEQGALRKHVNVFVGARPLRDREHLLDTVPADATVHVFQALSGG